MRASGYPGKAMYTMLIGAFSNLILAPIFIFWLDWGIKGAAIATDIAMAISAAFVMIHFFNPKSQLRFHRRYFKLEWGILFNIDTNLIDVAIHGMRIVMGVFPIVGFQIVTTNLFQSLGMASKSIFLSLTRQVIFLIPLLLIFPRIYALNGIWIAMPVSDTIATAITLLLLWRTDKKLQNKNSVITR